MIKHHIRHENLRRILNEFEEMGSDVSKEVSDALLGELKHSNLILAGEMEGRSISFPTFENDEKTYGFLFTDMDEFRKFFTDDECGALVNDFATYKNMVENNACDGFVINPLSETFPLLRQVFDTIRFLPQHDYEPVDAYTTHELKELKDSINNESLERFIENPSNIGRYEELFCEISNSTLLTLMVSRENLDFMAEDGVISMVESEPHGFLYLDRIGGRYATVYTSEEKISNVTTDLKKYSQIVNFSQLTNYILNDDLDGIIINPNSENVLITRDVLLDFWPVLEKECNDSRLYSAIMHMFLIEEEA